MGTLCLITDPSTHQHGTIWALQRTTSALFGHYLGSLGTTGNFLDNALGSSSELLAGHIGIIQKFVSFIGGALWAAYGHFLIHFRFFIQFGM